MEGKIVACCISEKKGTLKKDVGSVHVLADHGIENDAHAGKWHRQISLLNAEKVRSFMDVKAGAFGENFLVSGIDFSGLEVGTLLQCNEVLLEVSQIGKECHSHCAIYHQMGDCIMPREGIFARVLHGGDISVGDTMIVKEQKKKPLMIAVVTVSDQASNKQRIDASGPAIVDFLKEKGLDVAYSHVVPDEQKDIENLLIDLSDRRHMDLIFTTGGTGFSLRDVTPEATKAIMTRDVPGIAQAIRQESYKITPKAMLSRAVSVLRNTTLIINLPGSPKACKESLDIVFEPVLHGIDVLRQDSRECGR